MVVDVVVDVVVDMVVDVVIDVVVVDKVIVDVVIVDVVIVDVVVYGAAHRERIAVQRAACGMLPASVQLITSYASDSKCDMTCISNSTYGVQRAKIALHTGHCLSSTTGCDDVDAARCTSIAGRRSSAAAATATTRSLRVAPSCVAPRFDAHRRMRKPPNRSADDADDLGGESRFGEAGGWTIGGSGGEASRADEPYMSGDMPLRTATAATGGDGV